MQNIRLSDNFEISRIVHGYWRAVQWNLSEQKLLRLIEQTTELGINTFDHADIYGNYTCESLFGNALSLNKSLRDKIKIVTKCGITRVENNQTGKTQNNYNYSFEHIVSSVEKSLKNFKTDYIDLLLLHRPSPFFDPDAVSKAFNHLRSSGKVLYFGVSNFNPRQFEMLKSYFNDLVTNQVEISPLNLEHFQNGNIDFFLKENIHPMAWSPLAGGRLFSPVTEHEKDVSNTINEIADELNTSPDKVIFSWLLKHPAGIIPITGSGNIERIKSAAEAINVKMTLEQWFRIYIAANGKPLP